MIREEDAGAPVACAFCGGTFLTVPAPPARPGSAARLVVDVPPADTAGADAADGLEIRLGRSQPLGGPKRPLTPASRGTGMLRISASPQRCPECGGLLADGVCTICRRSLAVERGKSRTLLVLLLLVGGGLVLFLVASLLFTVFMHAGS